MTKPTPEPPAPTPSATTCAKCGKPKDQHIEVRGRWGIVHWYCYESTAETSPEVAAAEFVPPASAPVATAGTERCAATRNDRQCTARARHDGNHRAVVPQPFGGIYRLEWKDDARPAAPSEEEETYRPRGADESAASYIDRLEHWIRGDKAIIKGWKAEFRAEKADHEKTATELAALRSENDRLRRIEAVVTAESSIHGTAQENGWLAVGQALIDKDAELAALRARMEARVIADALYRHRYPRAMGGVEDRDHPSHRKFWQEADAVLAAIAPVTK